MKQEKKRLREGILRALRRMPFAEYADKSSVLENRFLSSPEFISADSLLVYAAFDREPETRKIIRTAMALGKRVFVPRVECREICVCKLTSMGELAPGAFGIHEPPAEAKCEDHEFDIIVVPGLAFDKAGHRLGRGGGFYDRLLKKLGGMRIGLAFDEQVLEGVPNEAHDVLMDKIFTNSQVVECRKN